MKTLLVTFDYPPMVGGIANMLESLWQRAGHRGSLILAPSAPGASEVDAQHPARTFRFPVVGGSGLIATAVNTLSCLAWFVFLAVRHRPELIIAGQIRRAGPLAHLWSVVTRRPFALWVYGGETSPEFTASRWTTRYMHRMLRAARYVFTISPYTTHLMTEFGLPEERVVETALGVREDLRPMPKDPEYVTRLGLEGRLVFLTVARLIERKGVDIMLKALAGVDDRLPPWHYLVVSDGPYRQALEKLSRGLSLQEMVTFTGYVEDHELPIYYNLCDVFAMPNREVVSNTGSSLSVEGFGMVFIDAAACGKPVVAGRSGGAVGAVDEGVNGLLVEPGDVESLQHAILRLTDAGLRGEMGRAGVAFASRFRWDEAAQRLRPYL